MHVTPAARRFRPQSFSAVVVLSSMITAAVATRTARGCRKFTMGSIVFNHKIDFKKNIKK